MSIWYPVPVNISFPLAKVIQRVSNSVRHTEYPGTGECLSPNSQWPHCRLIDSYARHKSPYTVSVISQSLLLNRGSGKHAARNIELIPANPLGPCRMVVEIVSVAHNDSVPLRFWFTTGVMILSPKLSDFVDRSLLGHDAKASGLCQGIDKSVDRDQGVRAVVNTNSESGTRKIDMENPAFD